MKEPTMRPLTIEPDSCEVLSRTVRIEALTKEAEEWMSKHAPKYGSLYRDIGHSDKSWGLLIYRGYNRSEVVEYLNDLWDKEHWPEEIESEVEK